MCLPKSSTIQTPPTPAPQEVKQPETQALRVSAQRNRAGMTGGSLLTGPSGAGAAPTGRATLLGQ